MTKLSDIQILLLTTASTRADGSVLPPSDLLGELSARVRKAIDGLIRRGLVDEVAANSADQVWRTDGDARIGLAITEHGKAAIPLVASHLHLPSDTSANRIESRSPPTKIGSVLDMLKRAGGATLDELVESTGWLPHTTQAALTGLRKKGHAITRERRNDASCYRIPQAA